jgi:hypothetical protein
MFQGGGPTGPLSWVGGPGFSFLLWAIALFGFAVILLQKSIGYQLRADSSDEIAPRSGTSIAWATVLIIVFLWLLRWCFVELEPGREPLIGLLHDILARPKEFALPVFVASIPLASLALFNFLALYRIALRKGTEDNLLAASAAATLITAIQLIGSIASIISLALVI